VSGADPRPLSAHCKARPQAQAPQAEAETEMKQDSAYELADPRIPYLLREARYLIRIGQWNDTTMRIVELNLIKRNQDEARRA
jgi:hypothetical protein